MRHNRYCGFLEEAHRGHLVAFDLQWKILEARRVDPQQGAAAALAAFVEDFVAKGWKPEGCGDYGFVFMNRDGERILLEVTPRDPTDQRLQSFSPYK
jgi:hypothetical protein